MPPDKPYRRVPIQECGEPLAPLPHEAFIFLDPHPYAALGASYGKEQPWMLRQSIVQSLLNAKEQLQTLKPGWKIRLTDAYRPNPVQAFMVKHEFETQAKAAGLDPKGLNAEERNRIEAQVYRFWAIPSDDPATPPPHSTGAAFDCTLIDEKGREVDMGSPVDALSDQSVPDYFANSTDAAGKEAHANRNLLNEIMRAQGFVRHFGEWWHFSRGDQLAVWINREKAPQAFAIYGRADLLQPK